MSDTSKKPSVWDMTKKWAANNPVITGMGVGAGVGLAGGPFAPITVVGGVLVGAVVGYMSADAAKGKE